LGVGLPTPHRKKKYVLRHVSKRLGPGLILWLKEDEVDGTCSTHGEGRGVYRVLVGSPEGESPPGRPRRRWEDNIKLGLRKIGIDGANWIQLAQDRVQRRAFVNTVMNLRVPKRKQDIFDKLSDNQLFK
jgi:hypothetical protein